MGLKAALILILFVALGVFLLGTGSGKQYLAFLQGKLRELTEAVPVVAPGRAFVMLSLPPDQLKEKAFSIANSSFQGYGIYEEMLIERLKVGERKEGTVDIRIDKGKLTFTKRDSIRIFATTSYLKLGEIPFASETPFEVSVEIEPINFTLPNVQEASMSFERITGELRGAKGTLIVLEDRNVALSNFVGDLIYLNQTVSLAGNVTKVLINGNDITNIVS